MLAGQEAIATVSPGPKLLPADLSRVYGETVGHFTAAFQDEALEAQAFERLCALIAPVVLTPQDGDLAIQLRGELASLLTLCVCGGRKKAPEPMAAEALQIVLVAGTGIGRCTTPFGIEI